MPSLTPKQLKSGNKLQPLIAIWESYATVCADDCSSAHDPSNADDMEDIFKLLLETVRRAIHDYLGNMNSLHSTRSAANTTKQIAEAHIMMLQQPVLCKKAAALPVYDATVSC